VPEQQYVAPDAKIGPLDHQVDTLGAQLVRRIDAGAQRDRPINIHVGGVGRTVEIDVKMLMRHSTLDVATFDRAGYRLEH
jgi:hypothetical protein